MAAVWMTVCHYRVHGDGYRVHGDGWLWKYMNSSNELSHSSADFRPDIVPGKTTASL